MSLVKRRTDPHRESKLQKVEIEVSLQQNPPSAPAPHSKKNNNNKKQTYKTKRQNKNTHKKRLRIYWHVGKKIIHKCQIWVPADTIQILL